MLLFVVLAQSALDANDNPYEILGVSKTSTRAEIKTAYRKLTVDYHPDLNRHKDTSEKWVRITDAYEFLLDSKRRELFDEFGIMTDSRTEFDPENNPFKAYQDQKFGNRRVRHEILLQTPFVVQSNFDDYISDRRDHLLLVVSGNNCPHCGDSLFFFEEFKHKAKETAKCGLIDFDESPDLVARLRVQSVPALVYIGVQGEKFFAKVRHGSISSMRDISEFLTSQWPRQVYYLDEKNFPSFLDLIPQQTRVIEVTDKQRGSMAFMRVASWFRSTAHFGVVANASSNWKSQLGVERLPAFLLFRNPKLKPMITENVSELAMWMMDWPGMCLFSADQYSIVRHCSEFCCLRCGFPELSVAEDLRTVNASTGWIEKDSNFARKLNMSDGDWIAYFPNMNAFARIDVGESETDALIQFIVAAESSTIDTEMMPDGLHVDWQVRPFVHETIRLGFFLWGRYKSYVMITACGFAVFGIVKLFMKQRDTESKRKVE